MADSDVIGGIENLTDAVSGETPSYEYKNPNTDMMKAISKCVDAATGETGTEYEYDNPNTDVIQKMEELATAIAEGGGGSSGSGVITIKLYKGKIKNNTGVISEDNDYYYTDFFPCSTDLTFDLGVTGEQTYDGLTLYGEDKTYITWYNPLQRYRNVQPSSSAKWCRLSFKASKSEYPLVHDWINNIVYTTETPAKFSDSSGGGGGIDYLESWIINSKTSMPIPTSTTHITYTNGNISAFDVCQNAGNDTITMGDISTFIGNASGFYWWVTANTNMTYRIYNVLTGTLGALQTAQSGDRIISDGDIDNPYCMEIRRYS